MRTVGSLARQTGGGTQPKRAKVPRQPLMLSGIHLMLRLSGGRVTKNSVEPSQTAACVKNRGFSYPSTIGPGRGERPVTFQSKISFTERCSRLSVKAGVWPSSRTAADDDLSTKMEAKIRSRSPVTEDDWTKPLSPSPEFSGAVTAIVN